MSLIFTIFKQQFLHLPVILRLSAYEVKSKYRKHYLGAVWQIMNPLLQIGFYWFVFGFGLRGGSPVGDTPFFLWLIAGFIPWFFIYYTVINASNIVYVKLNDLSKMSIPPSVLPTINIIEHAFSFLIMLVLTFIVLLINVEFAGVYLLQLIYYSICLLFLLFGFTLLSSTLVTIISGAQAIIQSGMRGMFFTLPIVWEVSVLPEFIYNILKLNPFFYIIDGFRASLLGGSWFYQDVTYAIYFWSVTLLVLLTASHFHMKYRHKLVDYL